MGSVEMIIKKKRRFMATILTIFSVSFFSSVTVKATTTPTPTPAPANTTIDYDQNIADQVKATLTANSSCIVNG